MLEIILLIFLCTKMGEILRAKGWKPIFMQVSVVVGWLISMFVAALAYSVYVDITEGPEAADKIGFAVYPWALLGAAISQVVLFGIAKSLKDRTKPPDTVPPPTPGSSAGREPRG